MALIQCRECKSEISDSAATCPRCGVASPGGSALLVFTRPSLGGGAIGMDVYVDGAPYGRLRAKGRIEVQVSPGDHHIEITSTRGASGVGTVRASSGQTVLAVKPHFLTGKPTWE